MVNFLVPVVYGTVYNIAPFLNRCEAIQKQQLFGENLMRYCIAKQIKIQCVKIHLTNIFVMQQS